jgi:hypothetical protein
MPTCYITLSDQAKDLSDIEIGLIRDIVAEGLNSGARLLDRNHISVRVQRSKRTHMLGDVEIEIFAQFFIRRFFSRDKRAEQISRKISKLLDTSCATWINMSVLGYSRVTEDGHSFFSD